MDSADCPPGAGPLSAAMHIFSRPGIDIAYIDEGQGDPILLIHGFASNHAVNWVNTGWVKTLTEAGRRVIALDNRGHGQSTKFHAPDAYQMQLFTEDAAALLDHLNIVHADVMGYSMGARITAFLAMRQPQRVRRALLGGLGIHLVEGAGLPQGIADALEAASLDDVTDPMARTFRIFADATKSDRQALAACICGSRETPTADQLAGIVCPVLISVGTKDPIAGNPHRLAALIPHAEAFDIEGRDHNLAVGDKTHKAAVLAFLHRS
jgi:pimeloyl-ACP methyl ester carboxylesterase